MPRKSRAVPERELRERQGLTNPAHEAVAHYDDFIRSTVDWVWEVDANLNYSFVSRGISKVIGLPSELLIGKYLFSLSYFKQVDPALLATVQAIDQRRPFRGRSLGLTDSQGHVRNLSLSGVPVFDSDSGRFKGYRGTGTELLETGQSLTELRDLRVAVGEYAELSSAWRWQADSQLRLSFLSKEYSRHGGLPRDQSLGRPFPELWHLDQAAWDLAADGQPFSDQAANWWHAGRKQERRFVISARPLLDASGRFCGHRGIAMDVTDHDRTEAGAVTAREAAEHASKAKSEFLANMSHELRTPLNAIIGFSDAMRNEILGTMRNKQYRQYADDIHASAVHLLDMVNQILDLSQIEAGRLAFEPEATDIVALVEGCCRMLRTELEQAGLELEVQMEDDLPLARVDPPKLKQVLLNLLANSIKFTQSGGRVDVFGRLTAAGQLEIEVRDTGIGIKAADIPKILSRFGQSKDADHLGKKGTGLGLSITKSLVELHGGSLKIVSRPGSGTRALVQLPAERMVREDDESEPWKILF